MNTVEIIQGDSTIILSQPHSGTYVPDDIYCELNDLGRQLIDTDWHVPELYEGVLENATTVRANFSRYVIDPNRDPDGSSLYPGQNATDLVPLSTFDGEAIWNCEPTTDSTKQRLERYHRPYHAALAAEVTRVKALHGFAIVYDCHSIRSKIPYLFDGQLVDLNVGDNLGASCAPEIIGAVERVCKRMKNHSYVINGRFRGGWVTRHYGRPNEGVHAIQMELAQRAYLESETAPFYYDQNKASDLKQELSRVLKAISSVNIPSSIGETL